MIENLLRADVNFSMKEDQSIKSPENVGRGMGGTECEETSLLEIEVAVEVEVDSAIFLKAPIFLSWAANSSLLRSVGVL